MVMLRFKAGGGVGVLVRKAETSRVCKAELENNTTLDRINLLESDRQVPKVE
jgi:hypothetical protein